MNYYFRLEKLPRTTGGIKYSNPLGWSVYIPQDIIKELTPMQVVPEVICLNLRVADPSEMPR